MERRILRVAVHPTSIIIGIASAVVGLAIALLTFPIMMVSMAAMNRMAEQVPGGMPGAGMFAGMGITMMLIMPIFYFVAGYISSAVAIIVFNFIAPRFDGVPIEFADDVVA